MMLFAVGMAAQEQWTMEQCMAYAAEHASTVGQARWDLVGANAEYAASVADFMPSLSASTSAQLSWGRNIDPETNTYNNVTTFANGYGLYASLTLFDGGQTYNRWRMARMQKERSRHTVDMRRDDCAIAAMMAYADAAYYLQATDIAADKLEQSESVLALTRAQEELGLKGAPDLAQAQATVADDRYNLVHQRNLYEQAMLALMSAMNFPTNQSLAIDTAMMAMPTPGIESIDQVYAVAIGTNPAALEAEASLKASLYRYRVSQGALWPSISLSAGISTSYFKTLGSEYQVPSFSEQFRNNRGEYLSVSVSIPLFDNLNRYANVRRSKSALESARLQRDEQLRKLHDDISRAMLDRDGYAQEVEALEAKVEADALAYQLNLRKYYEGLLSLIDLQLSANTYFATRLSLVQKQTLYVLKHKLVQYYAAEPLY